MHVIWKRPDGFQNALPQDFRRVGLSDGTHIWLHVHDSDWYPFQVSGDWSAQEDTKKLNQLTHLLDADEGQWKEYLEKMRDRDFSQQSEVSCALIAKETLVWLRKIEQGIRGNTWEVEIIRCALSDIRSKLNAFCE